MSAEQIELEDGYRGTAAQLLAIAERRPLTPKEHERLHAALLKARQACNALELCDPSYGKEASAKLDELDSILSEILEQGEAKVLVFSEWVGMLELAAKRLRKCGIGYEMLCGRVPTDKRPALLDRFRESPDKRVLLSSDAGGVGLNLQVASYVIHLDLPWNPARLDQRNGRAHRLGQTRGVSVIYLCAEGGIERGIEKMLGEKRDVREAALDLDSDVDELEAPSFTLFAQKLREVLEATAQPGEDIEEVERTPEASADSVTAELSPTESQDPAEARTPAATTTTNSEQRPHRAAERLRLARVVLEAGFPADAVRAAYDALAHAISTHLDDGRPATHEALVAAVYRDLLPAGRLAPAAPGVLARVHDLTLLELHGVDMDPQLAAAVVQEAEEWTGRLLPSNDS